MIAQLLLQPGRHDGPHNPESGKFGEGLLEHGALGGGYMDGTAHIPIHNHPPKALY